MIRLVRLFAVLCLGLPVAAVADDFDALMQQARRDGAVDVLVTSWQPVTGEVDPADLASVVTGAVNAQAEHRALMKQIAAEGGRASVLREFKYLRVSSIRVDEKALKAVKSVGNGQVFADGVKTLSLTDSTGLVGARTLWKGGQTGAGQIVAVLDSGVDADHPFLAGKVIREACFSMQSCPNGGNKMTGPGAARPVHFHGTHVAGIIAGENEEFKGVAPGARIVAVNVFSRQGDKLGARDRDILGGLDHVLTLMIDEQMSIAAVNMSLGGGDYFDNPCNDSIYEKAAELLVMLKSAMVVASGNEGHKTGLPSPACAASAVSVGAVDKMGKVADFSNSAGYLDLLAPGVAILSSASIPGKQGYMESDGTSMAAPHVTGAVALLRAARPDMDSASLIAHLMGRERGTDPANGQATPLLHLPEGPVATVEKPRANPQPVVEKKKPAGVISIGGDEPLPAEGDPGGATAITE